MNTKKLKEFTETSRMNKPRKIEIYVYSCKIHTNNKLTVATSEREADRWFPCPCFKYYLPVADIEDNTIYFNTRELLFRTDISIEGLSQIFTNVITKQFSEQEIRRAKTYGLENWLSLQKFGEQVAETILKELENGGE